jgi:putative DNA primase/helicase
MEKMSQRWVQSYKDIDRNLVGFHLACQLRDDGISEAEAVEIMLAYAKQVPQGKNAYTIQEALASLRSAYQRPPRQRVQRRRL